MKNNSKFNRGFIVPLIVGIVAVLIVGGIYLAWKNNQNKQTITPAAVSNSSVPFVKVLTPNGGENFTVGNVMAISWQSSNLANLGLYMDLVDSSGTVVSDAITGLGVGGPSLNAFPNNTYSYSIPKNITPGDYKLVIATYGKGGQQAQDESDSYFVIAAPKINSQDSINVTSPNGGETIKIGQTYPISWKSSSLGTSTLSVFLQDDSIHCPAGYTGCWPSFAIASGLPNTGNYSWNTNEKMFGDGGPNSVSVTPGSEYKIKVCEDSTSICDESNNYFTITNSASINNNQPTISISPTSGPIGTQVKVSVSNPSSKDIIYVSFAGDAGATAFNYSPGNFTFTIPNQVQHSTPPIADPASVQVQPGVYKVGLVTEVSASATGSPVFTQSNQVNFTVTN